MINNKKIEFKNEKYFNYFKDFIPMLNKYLKKASYQCKKEIKDYIYGNIRMTSEEKDKIWELIVK